MFGKELPVPLWEAPIYPVCASMEEAVHQTLEAWKEGFPIWEDGISLKDSFNQADLSALLPWQEKVSDKVELEEILEAIDRKENLTRLVEEMRMAFRTDQGRTPERSTEIKRDGAGTVQQKNQNLLCSVLL